MQEIHAGMVGRAVAERKSRLAGIVIVVATLLTILLVIPFVPNMPQPGLDPSWRIALNDAVARGLVFGRDLVFTFGPLGSVYTRVYHPATDWIMLAGSGVVAAGLMSGFGLLCRARRAGYLLTLPLALSLSRFEIIDSMFMALPMLLLLAAARQREEKPTVSVMVAFGLLAAAVGILPLIKGSFSGAVGAEAGMAFLLLAAHQRALAVVVVTTSLAAMLGAWLVAGQPLLALPSYFIAQAPIVAGYSGAMSLAGSWQAEAIAAGLSALLLLVSFRGQRSESWWRTGAVILGLAAYFFISLKAAFVRHDGHALLASNMFLFVGAALVCFFSGRTAILVGVLCLTGWIATERSFMQEPLLAVMSRPATAIDKSIAEAVNRLTRPDDSLARYREANAAIRVSASFKVPSGTVDVYSTELAPIFTSTSTWVGRPTPQSYSAYTDKLLQDNARHLESPRAAEHIFLQLASIDNRLPSQDDSLSWPILLTRYDIAGLEGGYVHLRRGAGRASSFGEERKLTVVSGQSVTVPSEGMQWTRIDVRPSLPGKLALGLYKLPSVMIELSLEDGRTAQYRLIPEIARHGFLLSPHVESGQDFVMAAIGEPGKRVKSFRVITFRPALWQPDIEISFQRMNVAPQRQAVGLVAVSQSNIPELPSAMRVPDCHIDGVEGRAGGLVHAYGWISPAAKDGIRPETLIVTLNGVNYAVPVTERPDVGKAYGRPELSSVGFDAWLDAIGLTGELTASVAAISGGITYRCPATATPEKKG